mgnify:CR=1 FL=1
MTQPALPQFVIATDIWWPPGVTMWRNGACASIAGRNDSPEDARRLVRLLDRIPAKVNLIPLNEDPIYLPGWKRPAEPVIDRFAAALAESGVAVTVRRSRGPDAAAACGQLKGRTEDPRKAPRTR